MCDLKNIIFLTYPLVLVSAFETTTQYSVQKWPNMKDSLSVRFLYPPRVLEFSLCNTKKYCEVEIKNFPKQFGLTNRQKSFPSSKFIKWTPHDEFFWSLQRNEQHFISASYLKWGVIISVNKICKVRNTGLSFAWSGFHDVRHKKVSVHTCPHWSFFWSN